MSVQLQRIDQRPEFKELVSRRWTVAIILTALIFITYYGFVITIGVSKATMALKVGSVTTLGIPAAVAVIIISFILTVVYVVWANRKYDRMASSILKKVKAVNK